MVGDKPKALVLPGRSGHALIGLLGFGSAAAGHDSWPWLISGLKQTTSSTMPGPAIYIVVAVVATVATGYALKEVGVQYPARSLLLTAHSTVCVRPTYCTRLPGMAR